MVQSRYGKGLETEKMYPAGYRGVSTVIQLESPEKIREPGRFG